MRDVSGTVLQTLGVLGSGNLAFRASYLKSVAPDPLYPDGGGEFTDGLEGTDITDGLSFGYSGTDLGVPGGGPATVEVTVDLGQVANLTGVKLVSGGGPNSSYCADSLEVLTSTDGVNFVSQGSVSGANARQLTLAFTTQARYVKFRITKNFAPADQPGDWLFLDEGYVYGTGFKNLLQPAQDASVVVDGIDVKRGSNVISDAVPGVTLSLKGTGSATVTVQPDVQAVAGEIEAVIKAYNAVLDRLGTVLAKGAVLQGDTSAVGIQVALRRLVSGYADKLRELGIASALDGKLSVDAGKLADALQRDPAAVRAVFFNSERTGLGDRLLAMLGGWIGITGSIQSTESSLNRTISSIREQIETLERRLEVRRQVLTARFLEMERALTLLQSQVADLSRLAVQQ
ncbi:flagellar filament capping protein FliD [Thermanaeromonas toyohensis]|nr:flagellar filament capping protein FliD [Thermanaeromonas toyohensis]